jgi:simple sugar transport system substrate-binding protein
MASIEAEGYFGPPEERSAQMRAKVLLFLAALVVGATSITACGGGDNGGGASTAKAAGTAKAVSGRQIRIEVVTHGQASAPFWAVAKKGVDQAAKDMGVTVHYQAPDTFDMVRMSQLIDAAVATKPDGLAVSIPDPKALGPAIERAVKAGIPVVSLNSGADAYKQLGILAHVGQEEYPAGLAAGQRMAAQGIKNALCLNGEVGNKALDDRCRGFADALKKTGGKVKEVGVKLADPQGTQQTTQAAIASTKPDAIFNTTNAVAMPALKAIKATGNAGKIKEATFDLGPDELKAVQDGEMEFAIDQQEYLQGYLPIVMLANYKRYGVMPGLGSVIQTGPAFVGKDTAGQVIELSKQGYR